MGGPLVDYIKKHVDSGEPIGHVRKILLENNFPEKTVEAAIQEYLRAYPPTQAEKRGIFSVFKKRPSVSTKPETPEEPEEEPEPKIIERPKPSKPKRELHLRGILRHEKKPKPAKVVKRREFHLPKISMPSIKIPKPSFKMHMPKIHLKREKPASSPPKPPPQPRPQFAQPEKKSSIARPLKIASLVVLITLSVVLAVPPAIDYYSRTDILSNATIPLRQERMELEEVNCAESGIFVERSVWSPELRHIILNVRNNGNVPLRGFEAQILLKNFELGSSSLHDAYLSIEPDERGDFFLVGPNSCGDIDRFTFKSLQCPNNALHTIKQNEIQNC